MAEIEVTTRRDVDAVSEVLAVALADYPIVRWLQPDPRGHEPLFRTLARDIHGAANGCDIATRDGRVVGAALWDPPGHRPGGRQRLGFLRTGVPALGRRVYRAPAIDLRFAKSRPSEPHWYLTQIGATPTGQGVGTALLSARLATIDVPAYLETATPDSVPLFERHGFVVRQELTLPWDGPRCWTMYRPAGSVGPDH